MDGCPQISVETWRCPPASSTRQPAIDASGWADVTSPFAAPSETRSAPLPVRDPSGPAPGFEPPTRSMPSPAYCRHWLSSHRDPCPPPPPPPVRALGPYNLLHWHACTHTHTRVCTACVPLYRCRRCLFHFGMTELAVDGPTRHGAARRHRCRRWCDTEQRVRKPSLVAVVQ